MKRLNKKRRARLIRLMHYRRRYAARIRRQRREDKLRYARSGGISRIPAPVLFSLEGSGPRLLLDFIRRVRQAAECGYFGLIEIDFRSTEKMVADGTLYFLANLEMLKKTIPSPFLRYASTIGRNRDASALSGRHCRIVG